MTPASWAIVAALTVACWVPFVLLLLRRNRRSSGQKIERDDGKAGGA